MSRRPLPLTNSPNLRSHVASRSVPCYRERMDELEQFLRRYEQAANSGDFDQVAPLITEDATFWFTNGSFVGRAAIRAAFEDTWAIIQDETY